MDDRTFAERVSAWVDPSAVLHVARAHASGEQIEGPGFVPIPGTPQGEGVDQLLVTVVEKLLRGFRLDGEFVALVAAGRPEIPAPSWDYLLDLRSAGRVITGAETGRDDTVLVLRDRAGLAQIVALPVGFLVNLTLSMVATWSTDPAKGMGFLEHSSASDWMVYLECTVADALGLGEQVRSAQTKAAAQVIYGDGAIGISLVSEPPFPLASEVRDSFEQLIRSEGLPYDYSSPPPAVTSRLSADDGFLPITEAEASQPWRNVARWRDECSPYAIFGSQQRTSELVIDSYYGRVFDFALEENRGLYGITEAMPDPAWTRGSARHLRSPYRKVPCFVASDLDELAALFGRVQLPGDGSPPLYRGQSSEFALPRSEQARDVLYGDAGAVEPSLLATSTRAGQPLESVLPAWVQLVRTYLVQIWGEQLRLPDIDSRLAAVIEEDAQRLMSGRDLLLYAVSLAQHYGLPTMGLDVTSDLGVALFFALHHVEREGRMVRFRRKAADDPDGILYVFTPDERFRLDHEAAAPRTVPPGRPERQQARFLVTGWGHHRNAVARHLAMAVSLRASGDFGPLPSAGHLFPGREEDLFGDHLESALEGGLPPALRAYVEQLYWVMDGD